jgi:uncharacterized alkaline shock family protein YloU
MEIAPTVLETIISLATKDVEGVAAIGGLNPASGIKALLGNRKPAIDGIDIAADEDGRLNVVVRIEVKYGAVLPTVAAEVRKSIADAVSTQVGVEVAVVDVYIDGVQFEE